MAVIELIFILGVGVLLFLFILNGVKESQLQRQLENAFYKLLEAENGYISLIQLAASARVDAELARQYMERQVKALGATLEVDADGDTFYRFPKLRRSSENEQLN